MRRKGSRQTLRVHPVFRNSPMQNSSSNWNEQQKLPHRAVSPPFLRLAKKSIKADVWSTLQALPNRWWKGINCITPCPCTDLLILSLLFGARGSVTFVASPLPLVSWKSHTMRTSGTEAELNMEDWGDLYWVVDDSTAQGRFIHCDSSPWQDYGDSDSCWGANVYPLHCFSCKALTNYWD